MSGEIKKVYQELGIAKAILASSSNKNFIFLLSSANSLLINGRNNHSFFSLSKTILFINSLILVFCIVMLSGCQRYAQNTPRIIHEGNNASNYQRVFDTSPPSDVTVINSIVISYSWRLGVVTTDDFEFENSVGFFP